MDIFIHIHYIYKSIRIGEKFKQNKQKKNVNVILSEEPLPQQRDDINAEQANKLSNSSECILSRKSDRLQLHQPYPLLMQRDRLQFNKQMPSQHDNHLVKSKSLSPLESHAQQRPKANYFVNDAMHFARSRSTSLTLKPFSTSNYAIQTGEDSSQSSLNLSASSGYLSGSSANSSNLNLSGRSSSSSMYVYKCFFFLQLICHSERCCHCSVSCQHQRYFHYRFSY